MGLAKALRDADFAAGILRRRPFNVLVQVTNRCNMKCSFCDFWPNAAPRGEELTLGDYQRVAGELDQMGCFIISIEGGEPFVRTDLVEIVRALSKKHITLLYTNGWYVNADNARALFDAGLTHASVSIDYPDAERHDAKRKLKGATERAWRALDHFLAAAPKTGARRVHVMTVIMDDNLGDLDRLFTMSDARGAGHQVTLLSITGFRRGHSSEDQMPPPNVSAPLLELWRKHTHLGFFREYFERMDAFLSGGPMPTCGAGDQSFNIDHVGNVSPCIERIDWSFGNVKTASLREIHARMKSEAAAEVSSCQRCWTACRGMSQALSNGGSARALYDLATRMKS